MAEILDACCGGRMWWWDKNHPVSDTADRHGTLSMSEMIDLGCSCEFGCSQCGEPVGRMGNCPGWNDCPIGREPDPDCRLSKHRVRVDLGDGAYMDTTIAADTSPETLTALRALGEATAARMKGGTMQEGDLIGKTVRIVGMDTGGGAGQDDFVSHICLEIEGRRVFIQATDPAHTWEIKAE